MFGRREGKEDVLILIVDVTLQFGATIRTCATDKTRSKKRMKSTCTRVPFTMEECYDIFRQIFHNEEDARAAVLQLFGDED